MALNRGGTALAVLAGVLVATAAAPSSATVLFQNTGLRSGWSSIGIQHKGRVDEAMTPTFKGPTALRMEQTFEGLSGYHSEVRLHEAQGPQGSDVYYGTAIYLPPNWIWHGQNVTFQQWARGDVFGSPWVLMFIENDEIRTGGSGGIRGVAAKITGMQGTWIRVVTHIRHHGSDGLFEVWVNGVKGFSRTGDVSPAPGAPIRWSVGMYCTRWRQEQPAGLNPMVMFHDHHRVATTLEEADPASWSDGMGTTPPPVDAGVREGGSAPDAGRSGDGEARPDAARPDAVSGTIPDAGAPDARDAGGNPSTVTGGSGGGAGAGAGGSGGAAGEAPPATRKPGGSSAGGCTCRTGGGDGAGAAPLALAVALLAACGCRRHRPYHRR